MEIKKINAADKKVRSFSFTATVWGEIRKIDEIVFEIQDKKTSEIKEYSHLELGLDDKDGERFYLVDKDLTNFNKYEIGKKGIFTILIKVDEGYKGKTKIFVTNFAAED